MVADEVESKASSAKSRLFSGAKRGAAASGRHGCQMAIAGFLESYVFCPSGFWTMAPICYAAKFDPFLSLDCARVEGVGAQSKERKGSNFAA